MFPLPDKVHSPLYVIAVISNPRRYRSRWELFSRFWHYVRAAGAKLVTVELAYGKRDFAIPESWSDISVRVRTEHELWHKENLVMKGFAALPSDWEYAAWVDCDIQFADPNWVDNTRHALQHYDVVQMFSQAADLDRHNQVLRMHWSAIYCYLHGIGSKPRDPVPTLYYGENIPDSQDTYWHPGFAWAIRRDAFDAIGGLLDWCIVGSADTIMVNGWLGRGLDDETGKRIGVPDNFGPMTPRFVSKCLTWCRHAYKELKANIGYVPGLITHAFHGPRSKRGYWTRWGILAENAFDPDHDIKRDFAGIYQLVDTKPRLRDQLREYLGSRDEDATE